MSAAASMLDREVYVFADVDRLIGLSPGTARRWINGYERNGTVYPPALRVEPKNDTAWVTWGEFVEARMLAEFRDIKKIRMARLRETVQELRRLYKLDYPLAHLRPFLSVHEREVTIGGDEVGLPDQEVAVRTGQQLLGDARWLATRATLDHDEEGEQIITELPADPDLPSIVPLTSVSVCSRCLTPRLIPSGIGWPRPDGTRIIVMVQLEDVAYVVDENLLSLGNGMVAVRRDTARLSRAPVDELLPRGIGDTDWIPIVGNRGWVMITNDRRLRTRPAEAELAITHKLKVVHLYGKIGNSPAWDQLIRIATRWSDIAEQQPKEGPWWLSLRVGPPKLMRFDPGVDDPR